MPQHNKKKKNHKHGHKSHQNTQKQSDESKHSEVSDENDTSIFSIKTSNILGRYLVARKLIKAGDIIIDEVPLVVGPPSDNDPVCLGCYRPINFSKPEYRCPSCQWPLCKSSCLGFHKELGHSQWECEIFQAKRTFSIVEKYSPNDLKVAFEIMLHLRSLLLKKNVPAKWKKLSLNESHNEIRKSLPILWLRNQTEIVNRIRNEWGIDEFSEEEIHTVCGMIEVNCFEIGQQEAKGRALYPSAFYMAHDCCPNTTHTDHPTTYAMKVRAMRDIHPDDTITLNYGYIFMGTLKRRENLNEGKFFWCSCRRCSDPTEFGTYCSALRCPKCANGAVLPRTPLDQKAAWNCLKCDYQVEAEVVSTMMEKLFKELDSIDPHDIVGQEKFIQKYSNVLTKNHYLILSAKYVLCQLYGRTEGYLIDNLSEDLLRHKIEYCREILKIINLLEPGLSRVKGIIMYELHAPLMILTGKMLDRKEITAKELRSRLQEIITLLETSEKILKMEPEGSKEHEMAKAASVALLNMKMQNLMK